MESLKEMGIYENTIVVFLTDNGPQQKRYKLGLRERMGSVYGGGVRVPCLIHYPEKFKEKKEIDATVAHIDLMPSLLDLCGVEKPDHKIDGLSFFDENDTTGKVFEERTLFFEWGRGYPLKYRNFAALKGDYKLVGNTGIHAEVKEFELFNVETDPTEKNNIVKENLQKATALKNEIDAWYDEIMADKNNRRNFPSYIGTIHENPVLLNRNDAKGTPVAWSGANILNYWEVKALKDGVYDIKFHFIEPVKDPGEIILKMYPHHFVQDCSGNVGEWTFKNIEIKKGEYVVEPYYQTQNKDYIFPFYVSLERIDNL